MTADFVALPKNERTSWWKERGTYKRETDIQTDRKSALFTSSLAS